MELNKLYYLGNTFFNTMVGLADFLSNRPFSDIVAVEGAPPALPIIADLLGRICIADIIFGSGLIVVITIKLIRFFMGQ